MSKTEFLERYGNDDSSRALIRFYFAKRTKAKTLMLISLGTAITAGAFIGAIALSARGGSIASDILLPVFTAITVEAFITLTLIGAIRLMVMSRKKLFLRLKQYEAERYIPENITASKLFKACLEGEPDLHRRRPATVRPHKKLKYYQDN